MTIPVLQLSIARIMSVLYVEKEIERMHFIPCGHVVGKNVLL